MHYPVVQLLGRSVRASLSICLALLFVVPAVLRAQAATGTITGRVLNEGTGQYLRSAVVTVAGTNISTVAEAGGAYTLSGVPAGEARVLVSFLGLDPSETTVRVAAGQTVTHDITMTNKAEAGTGVLTLATVRVVTEREGNFKAIQEQKAALEIKTVISSDAFGDVSEGNIGEFLKLMPGVMMDYVDADVRTVSIGGLDPKYAVIMMDGAPVASAGSSNIETGRAFEFEQLSISSIETVEMSKTPTPDVAGSALAGVINLRSKGAFDRKGRQVRWSASTQINSHQTDLKKTVGPDDDKNYKFQPNISLEYSDVFAEKLGMLVGYNFSRTFVEQNITNYTHVFDANPGNNETELPRMSVFELTDAPKVTNRTNYNLRLDYKISQDFMVWARADYNTYEALNFQRNARFTFNNAVNGPLAADPKDAATEYSLTSQTSTSANAQLMFNNTFNKHGATATFGSGGFYKKGAFRADVQGTMSRSTNFYHDVDYGYFHTGTSGPLAGTFRWERGAPEDAAINIIQTGGLDWRNPANYTTPPAPAMRLQPFSSKDQRWNAKADFRYSLTRWETPVLLKWGGDINEQVRNVNRPAIPTRTYLGPDLLPGTGDERWQIEPDYLTRNLAGGNLQDIPAIDRFAMAREYGAHPERFAPVPASTLLQTELTTNWDIKEQIDSVYQQTIVKVSPKFDIAPGFRMEKTRSTATGPFDHGNRYTQNVLTGSPTGMVPSTDLQYIRVRYGDKLTNQSDYHTWLKYLHTTYRWSNSLIFRASFNDSITRPNLNQLAGGVTINAESNPPSATISNPDLKPERGRNLFASAEYYFPKGAGFLTFSGARRDITDLIQSNVFDVAPGDDYIEDDGIDLGGYRVTTFANVRKAHVTSGELSYRQNLVFLPGFWRRLSLFGNYTRLHYDHYENFRRPKNIANGGVSFDHRGLSLRWNFVWVSKFRRAATPASGWSVFDGERLTHDMQAAYRFSRYTTVFASVRNVFNKPQVNYYGSGTATIMNRYSDYGAIWTVGVRGLF
ncbi:MAG: TonB-dependent receptor [Verrucomicrobiota bacterium]